MHTHTPLCFPLFPWLKACQSRTEGLAASVSPGWTLAVTQTNVQTQPRTDAKLMPFLLLSAGWMTDKDLSNGKTETGLNLPVTGIFVARRESAEAKEMSSKAEAHMKEVCVFVILVRIFSFLFAETSQEGRRFYSRAVVST